MPNLSISIPHELTRAEAKRRIQEHLSEVQRQYGHILGPIHNQWNGDTLSFLVGPAGQSVSGKVYAEDHAVRVEVALPWMFALLTNAVKGTVEREGQRLLGPPRAGHQGTSEPS
jgi:putative polyhydroxyalkanoate system protein